MIGPPPEPDQIELTLFGPGFGECAVVHLGANRWVVVDSCLDMVTGEPASLRYFDTIGVSARESVRLIVVSHWHDDHVRGLAKVITTCSSTAVCCSSALTKEEFLAHINYYDQQQIGSSGVREIVQVLRLLKGKSSRLKWAFKNCPVLSLQAEGGADPCIITTLSPSDLEYSRFLAAIGKMVPQAGQTKYRAPSPQPNHVAVAVWIEAGPVKLLLGSDLEETGNAASGWSAIIQSAERPQGQASIFKVPHHGSLTGHHNQVWTDMLAHTPIAVLSPFYTARTRLPRPRDVERIVRLAPASFITAREPSPRSKKQRVPAVERTIREIVGKIRAAHPRTGWVRLRNGGNSNPNKWNVELSPTACRLDELTGSI